MALTDWQRVYGRELSGRCALVTGAAGFIGSHLVDALLALDVQVRGIDDLSSGDRANLQSSAASGGRLEFVEASVLDRPVLDKVVTGCDLVFHQAAVPSVPRSVEQPVESFEAAAVGTLRVLEAARQGGVRRVMYAASSSAYGDTPTLPKIESMPPQPMSPYAAAKLSGEHLMQAYAQCYALDTVSLRYFNIFGPRQHANSPYSGVIAVFARSLIGGEPVTINGRGYSRDFTFVDNAVHANLLAATSDRPLDGQVMNVGCGDQVTIDALAEQMAAALGQSDLTPRSGPDRPGDVRHSVADLTRIRQLLGYEPVVRFEHGLAATMQWYQQTLAASH